MKKYTLTGWLVLMLISLLMPSAALAQSDNDFPPLTETYIADGDAFSFSYPKDWEVSLEAGKMVAFSVPIPSDGTPSESGIALQSPGMTITITIDDYPSGTTAAELVTGRAGALSTNDELTELETHVINGRDAAFRATLSQIGLDSGFFAIELADNQIMLFWLMGSPDQIQKAIPILPQIFGTLRIPALASADADDSQLSATYTRPEHNIQFDYPAHWNTSEQPDYVLLEVPNGVTIGISGSPPFTGEPADPQVLVKERVEAFIGRLEEAVGGAVDVEPFTLTINDHPAAKVDFIDGNSQYSYYSIALQDDLIATMTIIGTADGITEITDTIQAIAESLRVPDESSAEPESSARESASGEQATYTTPDEYITFSYPAAWELVEKDGFVTLRIPGSGVIDIFALPLDTQLYGEDLIEGFSVENLVASLQNLGADVSSDDIELTTINDFAAARLDGDFDGLYFATINIDAGAVDGLQRGEHLLIAAIYVVEDKAQFAENLADFEALLDSIQVTTAE